MNNKELDNIYREVQALRNVLSFIFIKEGD